MANLKELCNELSKLDSEKEFTIDSAIRASEIIGELSDVFASKDISPDALLVEEEDPKDGTQLEEDKEKSNNGNAITEELEKTKEEVTDEDLKNKVPLV